MVLFERFYTQIILYPMAGVRKHKKGFSHNEENKKSRFYRGVTQPVEKGM